MSNICLDYLIDSFLFTSDYVENDYSNFSDEQIRKELSNYRKYVLHHIEEIQGEVLRENQLNVSVEILKDLPTEDLYRQLALYMDQVVIPDPLFKLTEEKQEISKVVGEAIGLKQSESIDRIELVDIINYIKCISPLVKAKYVVMLPITLLHEPPKELPVKYSPNAFSDVLPQNISDFYHSVVNVRNMVQKGDKLLIAPPPLKTGTKIAIDFSDDASSTVQMFQYWLQQILSFDEATGRAEIAMRPAETISKETFEYWVKQSVNQAAIAHFNEKYDELIFARSAGCMFLTQSQLTAKIMNLAIDKNTKDSELATTALKFNLPVMDKLPLTEIIDIRKNYGEAFHNFRAELNSKLINLKASNEEELKKQIDNIAYELNTVQVHEVNKEFRKISKTLKLDALAFTGTLIASFATGGLTAIGAAASFVKGVADASKYYSNVYDHNGYFLWQLNKRVGKLKV